MFVTEKVSMICSVIVLSAAFCSRVACCNVWRISNLTYSGRHRFGGACRGEGLHFLNMPHIFVEWSLQGFRFRWFFNGNPFSKYRWRTKFSNFSGKDCWVFFDFYSPFGCQGDLKMIVSHRAPSSFNMSSYRAIWTCFWQNFIFFNGKHQILVPESWFLFLLKCQSSSPAILIGIWHIWECRSQNVSMEEPDLRFSSRKLVTCYKPGLSKTLSGGVVMGSTLSLIICL